MTLKKCNKCLKINTTKNAKFIGETEFGVRVLMFNCTCNSTFSIFDKKAFEIFKKNCNKNGAA